MRDGIIELFSSAELLDELEDVLGRETFATRLLEANVSAHELVLGYRALASVIEAKAIESVIIADPDDDAVLLAHLPVGVKLSRPVIATCLI